VLEAYDPVAAKWSELAPMPKWRDDVAAGSVNGIVYVIGGSDFGGYSARLDAYDPASNSWSPRTPMRDPRDGPTVAVANGILYVMGGGDSAALAYANGRPYTPPLTSVMEAYDPSTDSWTTKAPLPEPLNLAGAGVVNGILYLIGGLSLTGDSASASVYAYDPSSNTWTKKAPMPTARYGLDVGVVNGILYAVGGIGNPQWTYLATVEAYDPATDTWSEKPPISLARCCLNVAGIGDRLYAVGGGRESFVDGHDIVTGLLEVYSPK
jgi:N-acetylneuraminic acid mutarotase